MAHLERANELYKAPPVGSPYSVPLPGSQQSGRSQIYRHWRFPGDLLKTLDPDVIENLGGDESRRVTRLTAFTGAYSTSNV